MFQKGHKGFRLIPTVCEMCGVHYNTRECAKTTICRKCRKRANYSLEKRRKYYPKYYSRCVLTARQQRRYFSDNTLDTDV